TTTRLGFRGVGLRCSSMMAFLTSSERSVKPGTTAAEGTRSPGDLGALLYRLPAHLGMARDNPPHVRYRSLADAGSFSNPVGFPYFGVRVIHMLNSRVPDP